jgi:putative redox protein
MAKMTSTVRWTDGMQFVGESGSGHSLVIDGAPEVGGRNSGMRPMEMVMLAAGGCTAMDVVFMLRRGRQPLEGCWIEVEGNRVEEIPKVFDKIHLHYVLVGEGLNEKQVARAVEMSAEKYCSVSHMLKAAVEISYDYEIRSGAAEDSAE